ncbi:Acg family FMN-binding oxidoreductase [Hydrogenophaga sp. ZJX-1]|uniref:Acg family FMN-binding oxidoreductase n=1 Tax=Hydrogenophaga sp. ZJX-1 TaxID=3404778 RepID=UPI003B287AC4
MQRRQFVRIAGGGVVLAATAGVAGCSAELPPEALQAWTPPQATGDVRRWLLAHAVLAPHSHNLQSWLVDLGVADQITLFLDRTRLLPETDPYSRQMMMSQGTFLELLDLAARQRGLRAEVELFPEGVFDARSVDGRPTARVRLVPDGSVRPDPLFAQIFHRHTNREAYEQRVPDAAALQAISDSAASPTVRTGFIDAAQTELLQRHRAIAMEAWRIELSTPRTLMESYRVLRIGPKEIVQHRDGLVINDPMLRAITALGLFDRSQPSAPDSMALRGQIDDFNAKLASTPAFFWMVTEGNDRRTQINAGRAYVRAQLAATAHGLSMHPLQQALQEYPEQAGPYAAIHELLAVPPASHRVQMWARLGYAPPVGPAPRRGVDAHIMPPRA